MADSRSFHELHTDHPGESRSGHYFQSNRAKDNFAKVKNPQSLSPPAAQFEPEGETPAPKPGL